VGAAGGFGAFELLLAPQSTVAGVTVVLVLIGVCFTLYTANSNSTLQMLVPDQLRGRVMSLYASVFFGTAPLGGLLAGWLTDRGGTRLSFLVAGGSGVLMAVFGGARMGALGAVRRRVSRRPPTFDVPSGSALPRE
jgi:MFS family permease